MKIIYPEYQASATATSENSEYPAANLMEDRPSKQWKSTGTSGTVTIAVDAGVNNAVGVYGITADSVVVTIKNAAETVTIATETFAIARNRLWMEFTEQDIAVHVLLAFTVASGVCACGVVKVGDAQSIKNPDYGAGRDYVDTSLMHEMASGGLRAHQRQRYRNMNLSFNLPDTECDVLDNIYYAVGARALAMLILAGSNDWRQEWTGLFHIKPPPKTVFKYLDQNVITMGIREAV